jgi:hypothetical protein
LLKAIDGLVQSSEDPLVPLYVLKNLQTPDDPRIGMCSPLRQTHRCALLRLNTLAATSTTWKSDEIELIAIIGLLRVPNPFNNPLGGAANPALRDPLAANNPVLQQAIVKDLVLREMLDRQIDAIRLERSVLKEYEKHDRHTLTKKMRDPNPLIRFLAIQSASVRHIHCEEELINRLKDPVPAIREAARNALVRLSRGADFGPTRAGGAASAANARDSNQAIASWRAWLRKQEETPSTNEQ